MKIIQSIVLFYFQYKFKLISLVSSRSAAESAFGLFCTPYSKKVTQPEPSTFAEADKLTIEIEGNKVKGFHWKPSEPNGHKILICHGFDSRTYNFEKYVIALLDKKFEVLAFDAPAHGLSSGKTINVGVYRDMILKIENCFGPLSGIISHSFGGLATALAIEQLQANQDKRLVFIAPATETTTAMKHFFKAIPLGKDVLTEFEKIILEKGGHPSSWFSVARAIQNFTCPTLWIHDKKDMITPYADMAHLPELKLQHVKFYITEGLGHSKIYRQEEIIQTAVGFFKPLEKTL
jgi:pimeloyl-ACP methyl ester carboxylesterase